MFLEKICEEALEVSGLFPKKFFVLTEGVNLEEFKNELLHQGAVLTETAVMSFSGFAKRLLESNQSQGNEQPVALKEISDTLKTEVLKKIILSDTSRQRFVRLRESVSSPQRLKLLAHSVSEGRKCFVHFTEAQVHLERLSEDLFLGSAVAKELFQEYLALRVGFEAWSLQTGYCDEALILWLASEVLNRSEGNAFLKELRLPAICSFVQAKPLTPLEGYVLGLMENHFDLKVIEASQKTIGSSAHLSEGLPHENKVNHMLAHTIDDAADGLALLLRGDLQKGLLNQSVVFFDGHADSRRTINRALHAQGLSQWDARDPDERKQSFLLKTALIPLKLLAEGLSKSSVLSWLEILKTMDSPKVFEQVFQFSLSSSINRENLGNITWSEQCAKWKDSIEKGGALRIVLPRLQRGGEPVLSLSGQLQIESFLSSFLQEFPKKGTLEQWRVAHMAWVGRACPTEVEFFGSVWNRFVEEFGFVFSASRTCFVSFVNDRLNRYIGESVPAPSFLRANPSYNGVKLYRFNQNPVSIFRKVYFFCAGLRSIENLTSQVGKDDWYRTRVREVLASEFGVLSEHAVTGLRQYFLSFFRLYGSAHSIGGGRVNVAWIDYVYDPEGAEQENAKAFLTEVYGQSAKIETLKIGSHPSRHKSYQSFREISRPEILLARVPANQLKFSATAVEQYSKCPFLGLMRGRWRLGEFLEAEMEMGPAERGFFLHEVIRVLVTKLNQKLAQSSSGSGLDEDHSPDLTYPIMSDDELLGMIESVWQKRRPRRILAVPRMEEQMRSGVIPILRKFLEKEIEYRLRAEPKTVVLDDQKLKYQLLIEHPKQEGEALERVEIVAIPDRIDRCQDGLFVMDYKTSSSTPKGKKMLELGYRLQLPLYALAAMQEFKEPVIGAQFIQLHREGKRGDGIFFKKHNGKPVTTPTEKTDGHPTQLRAQSASLFTDEPADIWSEFEVKIRKEVTDFLSGKFDARPKQVTDCQDCSGRIACGQLRRSFWNEGEIG